MPKIHGGGDPGQIHILTQLLQNFTRTPKLTPFEFVEGKISGNEITEEVAAMFLCLHRHKLFLENVAELFSQFLLTRDTVKKEPRITNPLEMMAFLYLIVFELRPGNWDSIYRNFHKHLEMLNLAVDFFNAEEFLLRIIEEGCKIFDKDYILERVLSRIIQNQATLQTINEVSSKEIEKKKQMCKKPLTIPQGPALLQRKKVTMQRETEPSAKHFEPTPVPKTTYQPFDHEKLLEAARMQNRREAYALLAEARKLQYNYAKPKIPAKPPTPKVTRIVPKPVPKFDPVAVKSNTTTLMRQAALLAKEKEAEIKEIESLVKGAFEDPSSPALLEEIRKTKEEESLQDIERKHLQGLLTREEAILAKQRLFQRNQAKKQQYQEERIRLLETIDQYRREAEEKTKQLVEKAQAIERGAKDAEAKLLKERRCNAKLVDYETHVLLKQAHEEREEELNKKIQLIKELKLLQQISARNNKVEFDPTETRNLGLMCEMSIAELQERLAILKVTMKEELEERKAKIVSEKRKQQEMLEQMKAFVETAKGQKCKPADAPKPQLVEKKRAPQDILELREKLKQAREQRTNGFGSLASV